MILSGGTLPGGEAWHGARDWHRAVQDRIWSDEGVDTLKRLHVSKEAVTTVAMADAETANARSGGDVATAHQTVARRIGKSKSVIERARRALRELGLAVVVAEGRHLTTPERHQAGGRQIAAASTRVLITPPGHRRAPRRTSRDDLPRKGSSKNTPNVTERSPSRPVDNSPRPIWAQKLAARIDERMPWLTRHRHIGQLVTGLMRLALPPGLTAQELLTTIDLEGPREPSEPVRDPLAWFLHQVRAVRDELLRRWTRPTRPDEHVHDFRADAHDGFLGCLGCEATIERTPA